MPSAQAATSPRIRLLIPHLPVDGFDGIVG
jgi:hypothetical protein